MNAIFKQIIDNLWFLDNFLKKQINLIDDFNATNIFYISFVFNIKKHMRKAAQNHSH